MRFPAVLATLGVVFGHLRVRTYNVKDNMIAPGGRFVLVNYSRIYIRQIAEKTVLKACKIAVDLRGSLRRGLGRYFGRKTVRFHLAIRCYDCYDRYLVVMIALNHLSPVGWWDYSYFYWLELA